MPYIEKAKRNKIDKFLAELTWGDWNYIITRHLLKLPNLRYKDFQNIMGLLTCIRCEFSRRDKLTGELADLFAIIEAGFYGAIVGKYEDEKIKESGDIF